MSAEENKEKVRRFMEEAFGQDKPQLLEDLLDPKFVRYDPYIEAGEVRGVQTVKENITWFHNVFPDFTCTIEDQVAEGEKVVSRYTIRGTHQGEEFFGVPASGKRLEMRGIQIDRFEGASWWKSGPSSTCSGCYSSSGPFPRRDKPKGRRKLRNFMC